MIAGAEAGAVLLSNVITDGVPAVKPPDVVVFDQEFPLTIKLELVFTEAGLLIDTLKKFVLPSFFVVRTCAVPSPAKHTVPLE